MRDRGCNGHRILRRVLVDGRHLRLSRAISFHEEVVTATLAASSRGKAITLARAKAEGDAKALRHSAEEGEATEVSEARSVSWRRGKKTPTLGAHVRGRKTVREPGAIGSACPAAVRRSVRECRETLGPPVNRTEPKTPWGFHAAKVAKELGTHEVRVHVNRSGGRSRSDASRVLFPGRSQGLLENQGASQKEPRSTA